MADHYPPADTRSGWYADNYPGSRTDANVGVIHTTEGTSLPGYEGGATAPNVTAVPNMAAKTLRWVAHFPANMSARALRNEAGGVETNTLNAYQIELVGTCDPGTRDRWTKAGASFIFWPDAPAWALEDLAEHIAWANDALAIPIRAPRQGFLAYPASYGNSPVRMGDAQWREFTGWCGHQHVPENSHGDPGALDWATLERLAREQGPDPRPMVVDVSLVQAAFAAYLANDPAPAGTGYRRHVRRLQRALNAKYDLDLRLDGLVTEPVIQAWRRHEGKVDGRDRPGIPDWKSIRKATSDRYTLTPEK